MEKKTPQEKKVLSYAKDRRNNYGENDKASRISIPKRKAGVNRVYRRKVDEVLKLAKSATDINSITELEETAKNIKRIDWKKYPDAQLREVVEQKLENRRTHAGKGKTAKKITREFSENIGIEIEQLEPDRWMARSKEYPKLVAYADNQERATEKLKHLANVAMRNELGSDIRVQIDGEFITPTLMK